MCPLLWRRAAHGCGRAWVVLPDLNPRCLCGTAILCVWPLTLMASRASAGCASPSHPVCASPAPVWPCGDAYCLGLPPPPWRAFQTSLAHQLLLPPSAVPRGWGTAPVIPSPERKPSPQEPLQEIYVPMPSPLCAPGAGGDI